MNERQTAAVNIVLGTALVAGLVLQHGPRQLLATLQSSPALLGVGLLGSLLAVAADRGDRRVDRTGVTVVLAVVLVVPLLAAGYVLAGLAGVRATGVLVMLGAIGGSIATLRQTGAGRSTTGERA